MNIQTIKKICILTLILLSLNVFAQIDIGKPGNSVAGEANSSGNDKLDAVKKIIIYNGSLIGYAKSCGIKDDKLTPIIQQMISNFGVAGLSEKQIQEELQNFSIIVNKALETEKNKIDCSSISGTTDKINNSISKK